MTATDADTLVDEAYGLYLELNHAMPMWSADMDQIERWFQSSSDWCADTRARCDAMIARCDAAAVDAEVDQRVSLRTVAAALRQLGTTVDLDAERGLAGPAMGLVVLLHAAVPTYALVTPEHGERYQEKLRRFPAAVDELCERLAEAAAADRGPVRRAAARTAATIDRLLDADVADDPVVGQAPPTELDVAAAERFRDDLVQLARAYTRPALARLRAALRDHSIPAGRDDDHPGLVHLPGGVAQYAAIVEGYTQPGTTPEQVHETGLAQLARLEDEWAAAGEEAFGISDPVEVRRRLSELPGRQTRQEVERDVRAVLEQAQARAPEWFNRVPRAGCTVRLVEHGAIAFYRPPSDDGSLPGVTHFNVSTPGTWGHTLAAVTVHEGVPGHHYQIALAREDESLHELHRKLMLSAYAEGWALYVERIGDEMGLYPTPLDRLGMLTSDAWRAARMVVDTGLHALGWSRERAITTLQREAGLVRADAEVEVDRYCAHPGQAVSYMTGRLAIESARDRARTQLGEGFDIADFHDVVLSRGFVSLDALDELVQDWAWARA